MVNWFDFFYSGLAGSLAVLAMTFSGCEFPHAIKPSSGGDHEGYRPLKERVSLDHLESNFSRALWHMVDAAENAVMAVDQYVELPKEELSRTASLAELSSLEALGRYLPDDLTSLSRKAGSKGKRSAGAAEEGGPETINLQDELDSIVAGNPPAICMGKEKNLVCYGLYPGFNLARRMGKTV